MVLVVKDKQKYPTLAAFLAAAKAAPGSSPMPRPATAARSTWAALMFETRTQTQLLHVPYKGGALAVNDTLAGTWTRCSRCCPKPCRTSRPASCMRWA
jgi:tripartite-type tricarboxylate transporter receptor subunit TctC